MLGQDVSQVLSKASFIKKLRNQLCYRVIESDVLEAEFLQVRAGFNLVGTNSDRGKKMNMLFDVTDNSSTPQIFRKSSHPQNSALQQAIGANFLCSWLKGNAQGAQNKMLTKSR